MARGEGIGKFIVVIKAILTRVIFATHGFIAIWRVTSIKNDPYYWYLTASILALTFEGVFTLTIKKNQEWKWFCPSVFFYLCSVVPAIWLLEVDKFDRKLALKALNLTALAAAALPPSSNEELAAIDTFGVELKIPVQFDAETWATVIEQLLMLILIIGRWMLPKGGLTRDQLSQLLLVYIGTAADIIEFFDSFKDDKISSQRILCLLILSIWSWSLLQFTFVLTATKSRRTRLTADIDPPKPKFVNGIYKVKEVCCSIDVWGILINIILQDAPFLIFRMLLITYYKIISYMNIFFTCKNTLVIILQFYRLYVVQQEKNKEISKAVKQASVSGNLAKAVERAAFLGPSADQKNRAIRVAASSSKKSVGGPHSKREQPKKHRSQDSITSQQNTKIIEAARRERAKTGRRKSLSTGNLAEGCEEIFEADRNRSYDDDLELGISGSVLSGTNDQDSQSVEESEPPLDDVSIASEMPVQTARKHIRMAENPGVYKISGSRSSAASSDQGGRYRQDTGYSSSSKDSGNSNRRGRVVQVNPGRAQRISGNSRSRSAVQRRRQMIIAKELNSIEYGGIMEEVLPLSETSEDMENERIYQRRAAIAVVFFLFVVIFILCMVAIYGGINPKGLVLRETFSVRKSTKRTTTTPAPTTLEPFATSTFDPSVLISHDDNNATDSGNANSNSSVSAYDILLNVTGTYTVDLIATNETEADDRDSKSFNSSEETLQNFDPGLSATAEEDRSSSTIQYTGESNEFTTSRETLAYLSSSSSSIRGGESESLYKNDKMASYTLDVEQFYVRHARQRTRRKFFRLINS